MTLGEMTHTEGAAVLMATGPAGERESLGHKGLLTLNLCVSFKDTELDLRKK